jgi:hypothetical protein
MSTRLVQRCVAGSQKDIDPFQRGGAFIGLQAPLRDGDIIAEKFGELPRYKLTGGCILPDEAQSHFVCWQSCSPVIGWFTLDPKDRQLPQSCLQPL